MQTKEISFANCDELIELLKKATADAEVLQKDLKKISEFKISVTVSDKKE